MTTTVEIKSENGPLEPGLKLTLDPQIRRLHLTVFDGKSTVMYTFDQQSAIILKGVLDSYLSKFK